MSQQELLTRVVRFLDDAGVGYMVTGSVASSLQGEPRATHDVDIVVDLPASAVDRLVQAFPPPEFYVSADAARDAVRRGAMFNLISIAAGDKVDFWMLTGEAFDQARFARRESEHVWGVCLFVSSPEDTILAKLRWSHLVGGSEKQFNDALHVYETQHDRLDRAYLDQWAAALGVAHSWNRLTGAADVD